MVLFKRFAYSGEMTDPDRESSSPVWQPLRSPDLTELRMFCAAADLGSFGRAAIRCHVSQPAISKRLASLETLAGVQLFERSRQGVKLTHAGRRVYEEARRVLDQAEVLEELLVGLRRVGGPVRLACSHSAADAFAEGALATLEYHHLAIELVTANSQVVRDLVANGSAELGLVASRPHHTPYPGVRELLLCADEIICAVPLDHDWAGRKSPVSLEKFLTTELVARDPSSNARWTVETVLRDSGLELPPLLVEAATPEAARREALERCAPVLMSKRELSHGGFAAVEIKGLSFPRSYMFVLPAIGEPDPAVEALIERLRSRI